MAMVMFKLETFEGPLDLLLHLIDKNKVDILDIPIADILEQYMAYMDEYQKRDIDDLSDFLYMASELMYIKSRLLLPKDPQDEDDPRKPLVDMLMEYKKYKEVAVTFNERYQEGRCNYVRDTPEILEFSRDIYSKQHNPLLLHKYYRKMVDRNNGVMPPSFSSFSDVVSTKVVPVTTKVVFVLRQLLRKGNVLFSSLFYKATSRSEIVATFMAVLELNKSRKLLIEDANADYKIILNRSGDNDTYGTS